MQFHEELLYTYSSDNYNPHCKNHKVGFILISFLLMVLSSLLFADVYTFGGKKGWGEVPVRNGITTGKGRFGYESLELDTRQNKVTEITDLLLDFEDDNFYDKAGKYTVKENHLFKTNKAICGKGAALGRTKGGLVLSGDETSFFGNENSAGSFMIDFWICPSSVENGEVLLNWHSSRNINGNVVYQVINSSFYQNKVMTIFTNIFDGYTEDNGDVVLMTERSIIPNKWSHHVIGFLEDEGVLEYRVDGKLECIKYITDTGHEGGTIYPAVMGISADFKLCPNYIGLIDDFRILRSYEDLTENAREQQNSGIAPEHYVISGGRFESVPVRLEKGSVIKNITALTNIPPQTDIHFYIRGGDTVYNWTSTEPEWIQVNLDEPIQDLEGMYFQISAELFPDGNGSHSPSVSEIKLEYKTLPVPLPPLKIGVKKGDGTVTLSWSYSIEDTAGGYYVYYGNRSGEYLGRVALEGASPINVGNVTNYTISGLQNGTIYYFAIAAYSKQDNRIMGPLSKEVYARPSKR